MRVPFSHSLRLTGLSVGAAKDDAEGRPARVQIFVNRSSLGFEDIGRVEPAQAFELADGDVAEGVVLKLKVQKFANVQSLFLFIEGKDGSEHVSLASLSFFGAPVQGGEADYSQLKKADEHEH